MLFADVDVTEPPTKKRKTSKTKSTPAPAFDLVEPEFEPSRPSTSTLTGVPTSDAYGDATTLTTTDIADKSARRHTLRFHTSRIESSAARRSGARAALGGDDDVPYRERDKQKDKREQKEREKRREGGALGAGGEDLDDEEPEPREKGKKRSREDGEGEEEASMDVDAEGYYELVAKERKDRKEKKKKEHDEAKFASRYVLLFLHPTLTIHSIRFLASNLLFPP